MKYILLTSAAALALAACNVDQQAPVANPQATATTTAVSDTQAVNPQSEETEQSAQEAEDDMDGTEADGEIEVASADTAAGGACLATDVLANDLTFINEGTPITVSGNTITANGSSHDVSGVDYSTKPC